LEYKASTYLESIENDNTGIFAYERLVNSLSVSSLCDNGGTALDLGCGDGRLMPWFGSRYKIVYGFDCCPDMLAVARERCPEASLFQCNLEKQNFLP